MTVLGVQIDPLTVAQLHDRINAAIKTDSRNLFLHVNVHGLNLATEQPWLRDFFNQAEIVFCDGAGVKLGARILGHHIPERITYADWIWQLGEFADQQQYSLYFLGAKPGVAEMAAERLKRRYSDLRIAGVHHGYFEKSQDHPENQAVIKAINNSRPNILIVGMGMPLQEKWVCENRNQIEANVILTGGAVFDYLSGELKRAPRWMTDNSLEWLGRLLIEPHRLWQRYIIGNPRFLLNIFKQKMEM